MFSYVLDTSTIEETYSTYPDEHRVCFVVVANETQMPHV